MPGTDWRYGPRAEIEAALADMGRACPGGWRDLAERVFAAEEALAELRRLAAPEPRGWFPFWRLR